VTTDEIHQYAESLDAIADSVLSIGRPLRWAISAQDYGDSETARMALESALTAVNTAIAPLLQLKDALDRPV
jgi:hypothetical protein